MRDKEGGGRGSEGIFVDDIRPVNRYGYFKARMKETGGREREGEKEGGGRREEQAETRRQKKTENEK